MDFKQLLISLLVAEYHKTPEEAEQLVKKHSKIIINAIMSDVSIRVIAMAIEMAENERMINNHE